MTTHRLPLSFRPSFRFGLVAALLLSLPALTSLAAEKDFEIPGLAVGEKAPAFELENASGETVKLADLTQRAPVALVFHRSAGWCPFCQRQLVDLQKNLERLNAAGITVVGISYDSTEVLEQFVRKSGVEFTLLSDVGSKTIDAYGVRNKEASGRAEGIPHPVIFIVDAGGRIAAKLGDEGYRDRPPVDEIISAVKSIQ